MHAEWSTVSLYSILALFVLFFHNTGLFSTVRFVLFKLRSAYDTCGLLPSLMLVPTRQGLPFNTLDFCFFQKIYKCTPQSV